jgi:dihydrofolate reductase
MAIHETFQGPAALVAAFRKPKIVIVVAIGKHRALGKDGKLLWHIPDDLRRFKELTKGHPIIMGRKTFESILGYLGKPLPNRTNIVVTRDGGWSHEGVVVADSIEAALDEARKLNPEEIHIGGGADVYRQILPQVDQLRLTLIDDEKEADSFFPEYEKDFPKETFREKREWNGITYTWVDLTR